MKHKKLQVLLLVLLSGCTPGIEKVLKQIQTPGSGYIHIISIQSVNDELANLQNALKTVKNDALRGLIENQSKMISDSINLQCLRSFKVIAINCYKPPNPCPPPPPPGSCCLISAKYVSFFTRSVWGNGEIYINGKLILVLKKGTYNDLTKTRTLKLSGKFAVNNGDVLLLKLPVAYLDSANNMQKKTIEFTEFIRSKK